VAEIGVAKVTVDKSAQARMATCCACLGYCYESGRAQVAEVFQKDLEAIFEFSGSCDEERAALLRPLLLHESPWVRYYVAITLAGRGFPGDALPVLESLRQAESGLPGLLAAPALDHIRRRAAG
jgi:hypothetical protein